MIEIFATDGECPFDDCVDYFSFVYQAQVWEAVCSPSSDYTWARQRSSGKWLDHPIKIVSTSHDLPPYGEAIEAEGCSYSVAGCSNLIDSQDIDPERPRRWQDNDLAEGKALRRSLDPIADDDWEVVYRSGDVIDVDALDAASRACGYID
jgi:hypothetical protein